MRTDILPPLRFPRWLLLGLGSAVLIGAALLSLAFFLSRPQSATFVSPAGDLSQVIPNPVNYLCYQLHRATSERQYEHE